jgi:acetyltransferase-like isoleucine patch superfamily enzyme
MDSKIPALIATDPRCKIGRFTYGTPRFMLWGEEDRIEIGSFCSIAEEVVIFGGGEHRTDWITTYPLRIAFGDPLAGKDGLPASKGKTTIGNDVWIGYRAVILSSVTIGNGAVVGACAVVTADVPPYSIVAGNPARVVKQRFDDRQIEELLRSGWWNWPIEEIREIAAMLCSAGVDDFLDYAKRRELSIQE